MPSQASSNPYKSIWVRQAENQLVAGECFYLTGGTLDMDGVAASAHIQGLQGAAYAQAGVELIVQASQLSHLVERLRPLRVEGIDFRIEFHRLDKKLEMGTRQAIIEVANCLAGYPNLDKPQHRFALVAQESGWWFGRLVGEPNRRYVKHDDKPHRTSSSLPSRLARAMVNLASAKAQSILDPCCGTGSILLEASALGLSSYGLDWNEKMVAMSRQNIRHFGYTAPVELGDARQWEQQGEALVTDLPYGKNLEVSPQIIQGILARGAQLAPVGVYAAGSDISAWLAAAGYVDIELFRVPKSTGFTRYIHRAESACFH
ncbi:MAG: methyltransferase domain-containing protein [Candidatus Latescibacteria bacterium]|nr:methyltransferase domain-containing protein [Candidatus Latescibacterota bacterium]